MATNRDSQTVFERDLIKYCAADGVEYLRLVPVQAGDKPMYRVEVKLKKPFGDLEVTLYGMNSKKPRLWRSLDRAANHFKENYKFNGDVIFTK